MVSAVSAGMTASNGTSVKRAIFSRTSSLTGWSERTMITSGWMPMPRSSLTECWVGLVLSSPVAASDGASVTCTYSTLVRPTSLRIWRMASRNGRLSMSPTVPPTSTMTTSALAIARDAADALLDLVGDVRDHLDRAAQVVAAALLGDDRLVDAAGGHVAELAQVLVDEALVVTEIEVGLGAVIGHEHFAVLVRRHGPRIDVDVGIELENGDREAPALEQAADACGRDSLAQ